MTVTNQPDLEERSDYAAVGGAPAIAAVVERFYQLVLGDERLRGFFDGVEMVRLKRHQVALVSQVMGGAGSFQLPRGSNVPLIRRNSQRADDGNRTRAISLGS